MNPGVCKKKGGGKLGGKIRAKKTKRGSLQRKKHKTHREEIRKEKILRGEQQKGQGNRGKKKRRGEKKWGRESLRSARPSKKTAKSGELGGREKEELAHRRREKDGSRGGGGGKNRNRKGKGKIADRHRSCPKPGQKKKEKCGEKGAKVVLSWVHPHTPKANTLISVG